MLLLQLHQNWQKKFGLGLLILFWLMPLPRLLAGELVVGYYPSWNRPVYPAEKVQFENLTHIAHAFIWPNADGSLAMDDFFLYPRLVELTHQMKKKIIVSIGGWGQSAGFSPMAASVTARANFVANVVNFCRDYGYDGVDLDWEYPVNVVDRSNLTTLVTALRTALAAVDTNYILSIVVPSGSSSDRFDYAKLKSKLDWIGCMTYDFHGAWTDHAGHNAPLYCPTGEAEGSADLSIQYLRSMNLPTQRIFLGVPFYGRQFQASNLYSASTGTVEEVSYNEVPAKLAAGWTYHWDSTAKVPYLTDASYTHLLSYDDTTSVRLKCEYVKSEQLGGIIIWALGQDDLGNSQPLLATVGLSIFGAAEVDSNYLRAVHALPGSYFLLHNFPNPCSDRTNISFYLLKAEAVRLEVFNAIGQRIAVLIDEMQSKGYHAVPFATLALPDGNYFYRILTPSGTEVRKMAVMK